MGDEELNRLTEAGGNLPKSSMIRSSQAAILARNLSRRLTNTITGSFTLEEVTVNSISLGLSPPRLLEVTFFT